MNPSKQHFLFLLLLTFIVRSQVLNPIGNCLGNCVNCAPNDLSACKGGLSCEWGYYINTPNGTCSLAPSKEVVWAQLGQRTGKNVPPVSESWGDSTKQITCEYNSPTGKKYIDALGLFGGVTMLEKTFPVNSNSKVFELSFNLLRDEWMPFNDFLLIDISSKEDTLQSIEISYEKRIKVESQHTAIFCGSKRVINEKFNVKIQNNNDIGNTLTIVFTSFLYSSQWALSNVKLISGCTHFTSYDQNTEACTICDTDSYLQNLSDHEKVCNKCPSLCKTCSSSTTCLTCLDGSTLDKNGTCNFGSSFKTQQIATTSNLNTCGNYSFYLSNWAKKVTFQDIKNQYNFLYDEIQLHFKLYYNPNDWLSTSTDKISIKINKIQVFTLTSKNLTMKGTMSCKLFKSNQFGIITIMTPKKVQNDNLLSLQIEYIGKNKDMQFGVSDVFVKSMKKIVEPPKPVFQNHITDLDAQNNHSKVPQLTSLPSFILPNQSSQVNHIIEGNSANQSKQLSPSNTTINHTSLTNTSNNSIIQDKQPVIEDHPTTLTADLKTSNTSILNNASNSSEPKPQTSSQIPKTPEIIQLPVNNTQQVNNAVNASKIMIEQAQKPTIDHPNISNIQNSTDSTVKLSDSIDIQEGKTKIDQNVPVIQAKKQNLTQQQTVKQNTSALAAQPITPSQPVISEDFTPNKKSVIDDKPQIIQPTYQNPQTPKQSTPSTKNIEETNINNLPVQNENIQGDLYAGQQAPVSTSIAYIPTSNSDHSGLHVVIGQMGSVANSSLHATIDKLDATKYTITDTYIQDNDLHLFIAINASFIDGKLTVYKVSSSRLMQTASKPQYTVLAVVNIDRYDSLSSNQLFSINAFSVIFQIFSWLGLIGIIIAILSGYGIVMEQYIMSLQLLFLHVYIAADYLPLTFRDVIGGLNTLQNLNFMIASHGASIQKSWLGNVIQNGPIRFFLFNTDINFTREFYPVIIINIAYAIWFMGLYLSKRFFLRKDLIDEEKPALYRILDNIVLRPINYLDQIWRYQFLATVWCCFMQFYNLSYPSGSNRSEIINALLCVFAFICSLAWPVFLGFYCRKYYYENQYSDYLYRFEDIYFHRIPEYFLPSNHHRVGFPIVRSAKLFCAALVIAYLGNIASLTLLLLICFQLFEAGYAKYHQIFNDHKYFAHRLIQNALFALIELILFFLCTFSSLALTESYVYIGFILSGMALVIVLNSLARVTHLAYQKYRQMFEEMNWQVDQMEKPKTERVV